MKRMIGFVGIVLGVVALTQIGNDYYTSGSSFNVTPKIYHSTDLTPAATAPDAGMPVDAATSTTPDAMLTAPPTHEDSGGCGVAPAGSGLLAVFALLSLVAWLRRAS